MTVTRDTSGDHVCVHGTAMDVHCCNCHSGFLFEKDHVCPPLSPDAAALPCEGCGGDHLFDTSVPSPIWNAVIRDGGLPEYLCFMCIVAAFARAEQSFSATLWGQGFNGLPIVVTINDQAARDLATLTAENTALRRRLDLAIAYIRRRGDLWLDPKSRPGHTVDQIRALPRDEAIAFYKGQLRDEDHGLADTIEANDLIELGPRV